VCEERGGDYFGERLRETLAATASVRAQLPGAAGRVEDAVRAWSVASRASRMPQRASRFRRAQVKLARTAPGTRALRDALAGLARQAPWKAAWVIAASLGELAGRPPPPLEGWDAWGALHARLAERLGPAPRFEEAVAELPPWLELGCRVHPDGIRFAIQLRDPGLLGAVVAAMSGPELSSVAREVLVALGPRARCPRCERDTLHIHLARVRDVDPVHALACSRCGSAGTAYRAYGRVEGLEALSPYARSLGLVEEQAVRFGGARLRLELHPRERAELTAARLVQLFRELLLAGLSPELGARRLSVRCGGAWLGPSARLPRGAKVTLIFADREAPSEARVVALLGARRRRPLTGRG
jgi:hypothetical protein